MAEDKNKYITYKPSEIVFNEIAPPPLMPKLYPAVPLVRGDHVLILYPSIKGWHRVGVFLAYTNSGANVRLFYKGHSYTIWHPKNSIVLLGRTR